MDDNARQSYRITIDVDARILTLLQGDRMVYRFPVAVGKPSTPTPLGNFTILNKIMNPGGVFGARWMGFTTRGHGIHGTNNPSSIGTYASHGCVRMYNDDVIKLYNLVSVGTPITIFKGGSGGQQPGPQPLSGNTYTVKAGDTLWKIAQQFGTTVQAIKILNHLTSDTLYVGQQLKIPK